MVEAMPQLSADERVCFELVFRPNVVLTTAIRRFVSNFYENVLGDEDSTARVAMATQELLENAAKYGTHGDTVLRIELVRNVGIVRIHSSNRSDPAHIATLQRRISEIRAAPDPFVFYQSLLRTTISDPDGSGLGLARIRCEGEMEVGLTIDGDRVAIDAVARTGPGVVS
jgi:hypothetical protein